MGLVKSFAMPQSANSEVIIINGSKSSFLTTGIFLGILILYSLV